MADTLLAWKLKPTLMKRSYKRFENAVMPGTVGNGKNISSIPSELKSKQSLPKTDKKKDS